MLVFITVLHLIVALFLIVFVLLQDSKGGAMGMLGGGGSNTLLGSTGASSFLVKATRWLAIIFAVSCVFLTYKTSQKSKSILDSYTPAAAAPQQTAPATTEKADAKSAAETSGKEETK